MVAALLFGLTLAARQVSAADPKPEKSSLNVAIAAYGPLYLPLLVAHEAGYFSKRGVNLNISQLSATARPQRNTPIHSRLARPPCQSRR